MEILDNITNILGKVSDFVWGIPLIVLILATGLLLTIRLKGIQITKLPIAIKNLVRNERSGDTGEVSSFGALCTALSATIGTGNIVGVATAIAAGGPGALFWMWMAALVGTFTQINGITSAAKNFFDPNNRHMVTIFGMEYSWAVVIAGILLTIAVALVLIGGLQRISKVAEVVVPFMALLYVITALIILICNITKIPAAIVTIVQSAFGARQIAGGLAGFAVVKLSMRNGIARGIFSNESGIGSAPIAAAAAHTDSPAHQGLISMLGTVIDTLIICTMTGLVIVITGANNIEGLEGVAITTKAFQLGLPFPDQVASFVLMVCLIFFAFTTILGWDYYSERCLDYLTRHNKKKVLVYRWIYILCVFIGPYMTVKAVWTIADIVNGLMALPNLIALLVLSPIIFKETKSYFERHK